MVCSIQTLLFSTLVMTSSEGESTGFRMPVTPEGEVDTYLDQGLARNKEGQIIDYWRSMDDHIVRLRKLEIPTENGVKKFDVVIISQREGPVRQAEASASAPRSLVATSFVPNLFTYVRDFVYRTYQARAGTANGDLVINTLKSERDFLNGFSTMVVITDENDFSKIHATFRVVRRGGTNETVEPLDVETNLSAKGLPPLPRIEPKIVEVHGHKVAMGDYAELKTLAVDHSEKIDFVPYLLRSFDAHAMYAFGQRRYVRGEGDLNPEIDGLPWGASHLVIEADAARAKLYERNYGFQVDEERSKDGLFVLTTSLDSFLERIRTGDRNDNPLVQAYVAQAPVIAWTPRRILSREARSEAQKQAETSALFSQEEAWSQYLFGPLSFYVMPPSPEPGQPSGSRLDGAFKFAFNKHRYFEGDGTEKNQKDLEAVARGFAPPNPADELFESREELYNHILKHPDRFYEDVPLAVEYALAHRKSYPAFNLSLASLLGVKNSKFIYQAFKVDPAIQEGESDEIKARREAAIELQFRIFDDFYTNPPADDVALDEIKSALRRADIPFEAGRVLTKLPRLGRSDRKVIFEHTLFYRDTVRDALNVVIENETLDELEDRKSTVSTWFSNGYSYRFKDTGWDLPGLVKTVRNSKSPQERKEAAEKLFEAVQLAKELEYILEVMKKRAPQFHKRLSEDFASSIHEHREAQKAYAEWDKQEREIRNGLRARHRRSSSAPHFPPSCRNQVRDLAQ